MSLYESVIAFAEKAKSELPRLDALLANAGIATRTFGRTEDNEQTITTNVVSLFLLGFLLHPKLHETAEKFNTETHLTITASELYEVAKFQERNAPDGKIFATLNDKSTANMGDRYNVSKFLEVLMVKQMAAMFPLTSSKVIINCVAPGYVTFPFPENTSTNIVSVSFCHSDLTREVDASSAVASALLGVFKKLFARSTEVGSRTLVYGASVGPESHGQYVPDCNIKPTKGLATGDAGAELQKRVWEELREKLEGIRNGVTALA
jgi:NAD(P)-dependent dehydrogenase (short-subunit alcohol dehydrogenase family)